MHENYACLPLPSGSTALKKCHWPRPHLFQAIQIIVLCRMTNMSTQLHFQGIEIMATATSIDTVLLKHSNGRPREKIAAAWFKQPRQIQIVTRFSVP